MILVLLILKKNLILLDSSFDIRQYLCDNFRNFIDLFKEYIYIENNSIKLLN